MEVRIVTNITKEYPTMIKVHVYKQPQVFVRSGYRKRDREEVDDGSYAPTISSLNRTKSLVKDIIICNNFELFCTFTFNPDKINSFSFNRCKSAMTTWLHHQRDLSREKGVDFKYLVIPEQHKSGRWHFHALVSGYTSTLKATKHLSTSKRPVFNITSFRSGFTTAVPIDSSEAVGSYVSKYITKSFVKMFNQRRFFCSKNLIRPVKTVNNPILSSVEPLFKRQVAETYDGFDWIVDFLGAL